jgi:hypothetical protein
MADISQGRRVALALLGTAAAMLSTVSLATASPSVRAVAKSCTTQSLSTSFSQPAAINRFASCFVTRYRVQAGEQTYSYANMNLVARELLAYSAHQGTFNVSRFDNELDGLFANDVSACVHLSPQCRVRFDGFDTVGGGTPLQLAGLIDHLEGFRSGEVSLGVAARRGGFLAGHPHAVAVVIVLSSFLG